MALSDYMIDHFAEDRRGILGQIQALEKKRNLRLLNKIEQNSDVVHFYSWLSEMRFGLFLDRFCETLFHDRQLKCVAKGNPQTPDWTTFINGQQILFEVLRINKMTLQQLKEYIDYLHAINRDNKAWGYTKYIPKIPTTLMSSAHFYGCESYLTQKEVRYRDTINEHKLPFIICPAPIFLTGIGGLDAYDSLVGHNKKGLFYSDENFGKNVTGVLLLTSWSDFFYFHNECAKYKLNEENYNLFQSFAYKENWR